MKESNPPHPEKKEKENMERKLGKAQYIEKYGQLVINTKFIGPDGCNKTMTITGIPNKETALAFLTFMEYNILLEIIK